MDPRLPQPSLPTPGQVPGQAGIPNATPVSAPSPQPFTAPIAVANGPTAQAPTPDAEPLAAAVPQSAAGPQLADDTDLIEKEWVAQVKHVVRSTINDPYEFNRQFTNLKAEYMQKRYGRDLKVSD